MQKSEPVYLTLLVVGNYYKSKTNVELLCFYVC